MYFVVLDGFKTVPEVAGVADEVPSYFFSVLIEAAEQLVIAFFHGFKFLLGTLFAIRERHDTGDFSLIVKKSTIQLSVDVSALLKFFSMAKYLDMAYWINFDLLELELQTHHC